LIEVVSCGGNFLINIGPSAEGTIVPIQEERLMQMGEWLELNGAAIYDSVPWEFQNDTLTQGVWYTANPTRNQVYGFIVNNWPGQQIHLGAVDPDKVLFIAMFGTPRTLEWTPAPSQQPGIIVYLPRPDENSSKWAWTLAITLK
jgi:alpha-L-fucosidase